MGALIIPRFLGSQSQLMHSTQKMVLVKCLLGWPYEECKGYLRRPSSGNIIAQPSTTLAASKTTYVYLGPHTNAARTRISSVHRGLNHDIADVNLSPGCLVQIQLLLHDGSTRIRKGTTYNALWSPSKGVVKPAVNSVRTHTASTGAAKGRSQVMRSSKCWRWLEAFGSCTTASDGEGGEL